METTMIRPSCHFRSQKEEGDYFGLRSRNDKCATRGILSASLLFPFALSIVLLNATACGRSGASGPIILSGNVETDEVVLAFEVPGRLVERLAQEGREVKRGALVARLDPADLEREAARAEAAAAASRAQLDELEHGSRPEEVRQGQAALASAKADLDRASADFERVSSLHREGVLSRRDYDASLSARDMASARLSQAEESLALLRRGPRAEKIEAAKAQFEQAGAALALARSRLEKARLVSPMDGVILSKHAEPGEVLSAGSPVVTTADLAKVWVRAFVEETDLGRIKLGQRATVTTDTYPGKPIEGRVSFISSEAEFTPKSVQTKKERVKLVYRVKVDVPNASGMLKPGMPVDLVISEE